MLHHPAHPRPAFTLIELLVVVAIITLLLAILLPSLARARETAKTVTCLSNLRQMAIATQTYAANNDGRFPLAQAPSTFTATSATSTNWDFITTTDFATGNSTQTPGLLWQGTGNMKIQQCPSFTGNSNTLADPYTGYNYNTSYIGRGDGALGTPAATPARTTELTHPFSTALFGDGQYAAGADKFMRSPFPSPYDASFSGRYAGTQGFRHLGKTNVLFADSHGEPLSTRCTTAAPADQANIAPATGFLSIDNSMYQIN